MFNEDDYQKPHMTFKLHSDKYHPDITYTISEGNGVTLTQVLEHMQNFLYAVGYVFKGELEIVDEDSDEI